MLPSKYYALPSWLLVFIRLIWNYILPKREEIKTFQGIVHDTNSKILQNILTTFYGSEEDGYSYGLPDYAKGIPLFLTRTIHYSNWKQKEVWSCLWQYGCMALHNWFPPQPKGDGYSSVTSSGHMLLSVWVPRYNYRRPNGEGALHIHDQRWYLVFLHRSRVSSSTHCMSEK